MVSIGELPGGDHNTSPRDISGDGTIIVGAGYSTTGFQAFRYESETMIPLKTNLPNDQTFGAAESVSLDGSKVVGWILNAEPVMWTDPNTFTELGDLPGGSSKGIAYDITADGSIVVGWVGTYNGSEAFIWDAISGMRNLRDVLIYDYGLDLTGWGLWEAIAISDDGLTIVGNGNNPDGKNEGWVARLGDPIPTCQYILKGDVNNDCIFNLIDLGFIVSNWLVNCEEEPTPANCVPKVQ